MLVFGDAKLIYVATPKTGGTAVETAYQQFSSYRSKLLDVRSMHVTAEKARKIYGDGFTIVGLIREPVSWVCSKYRYLQGPTLHAGHVYSTREVSFSDFVDRVCLHQKPWPEPHHWQHQYLRGADVVFQYEQFDLFEQFMLDRLGFSVDIDRIHVSPIVDVNITDELRRKMLYALSEDVDLHTSSYIAPPA